MKRSYPSDIKVQYVPTIEEVMHIDYRDETLDVYEPFGRFDTEDEAMACRDEAVKMALADEFGKRPDDHYAFSVFVYAEKGNIVDVIEVIDNINAM